MVIRSLRPKPRNHRKHRSQGRQSQIGEKIDRGLNQIGSELSQAWADVRKSVEKMGVQGASMAACIGTRPLENAKLEISVRDNHAVVLSGNIASAAAKEKAEELARDTIGVGSVVNELTVASAK